MGRPIEIKLDAETTGAEKGLDNVADALDDVADALDDVDKATRDTDSGLDDVARSARDAADAADESARTLDRDLTTALRDVKDEARKSAREIKDSFEENALTADDVLNAEIMSEILSNAAESGAEIARGLKDGFDSEDLETIVDGITDTIVSVGAVGGPAGVAAGLAAASIVQLFVGPFLEKSKASAAEFEETYATAFQNIVDAGTAMGRELTINETTDKLAQDTAKINAATDAANQIGVQRGIVLRAMAGDTEALNLVTERYNDLNERQATAAKQAAEELLNQGSVSDTTAQKVNDLNQQLQGQEGILGTVTGAYENNTDALNAASEAASAKGEADAYAAQKATDSALAMAKSTGEAQTFTVTVDGAARSLAALPDGKVVEVTDDGTVTSTQVAIDGITGKTVEVGVQYVANTAELQRVVNAAAREIVRPTIAYTPSIGYVRSP